MGRVLLLFAVLCFWLVACSSASLLDGGPQEPLDADGTAVADEPGYLGPSDGGGDLASDDEAVGPDAGDEPGDPAVGDKPDDPGSGDEPDDPGAGDETGDPGLGDEDTHPGAGRPPPSRLPFSYSRTDVGEPVTSAELQAVTDRYLELLRGIRYFKFPRGKGPRLAGKRSPRTLLVRHLVERGGNTEALGPGYLSPS